MGFKDKKTTFEKPGGFKYKKRSAENWIKRKNNRGGGFDTIIKGEFQTFSVKVGDSTVRPMPPTWDHPEHFGFVVWVHFGIGPDNSSYLCRKRHGHGECPICEEQQEAAKNGNTQYADELKAKERVAYWIIDRKHPTDGPKVYVGPQGVDRDIVAICVDEDSGEVLSIDDPDEGFDVSFSRKGEGLKTKYFGFKVARRPSPLSSSPKKQVRWLKFIVKHPLPSTLQFYEYDYIKGIFSGKKAKKVKKVKKGEKTRSELSGTGKKKKLKKSAKEFLKPGKKKLKKKLRVDDSLDGDEPKKGKIKSSKKKLLKKKIKSGFKD